MKRRSIYKGRHFPPEIISYAVWMYARYTLSLRDVEEILAKRGIVVSYETIRRWCLTYGPIYTRRLRKRASASGDTWLLDEVFVSLRGERYYLWRAIDQDGDVIDILLQNRRDSVAAKRFLKRLVQRQQSVPNTLVTDKLGSYGVAHRELLWFVVHKTSKYSNNRCEASHRPTREQERQMKGFRDKGNTQRFLELHSLIGNLMNWSRHLMSAPHYREVRAKAFCQWSQVSCA